MKRVSVVIPTYNGKEKLPGALAALEKQTLRDVEIIVSDDGSTDGTSDRVRMHAPHAICRTGPNLGRAGARNAGAKLASGEYLVFLDDDMRPEPDCLQTLVERAEKHEGIFTGAQWIPNISLDDPEREECRAYRYDLERRWQSVMPREFGALNAENLFFTAAICLIPRNVFEKLGGFEERLRDAEDLDFGLRALEAGVNVFYEPKAVAWHHDFVSIRRYVLRQIEYRNATAKLLELRPHYVQNYTRFGTDVKLSPLKHAMYFFVARPYILDAIYRWRKGIPGAIRYRLYDRIIAGLSLYFPERMN